MAEVAAEERLRTMSTKPQRTCPSCGNEFSGAMEFCPVCMLRKGLAGGVASGESSFEEPVKPAPAKKGSNPAGTALTRPKDLGPFRGIWPLAATACGMVALFMLGSGGPHQTANRLVGARNSNDGDQDEENRENRPERACAGRRSCRDHRCSHQPCRGAGRGRHRHRRSCLSWLLRRLLRPEHLRR